MLVMQLAKSAIDALVLDRLQHPPPQVPREFSGECPGGAYRLRWCRPALTFPDDAPGMVRMGMAIEGGVHLDTGRILSCDAFVTATAAPALAHDENGWYMRLTVAQVQVGTVHLDYAGHDLVTASARLGSDLLDDATAAQLRTTLTERIIQFCDEFPDIPLTYVFPAQAVTATTVAVRVRPESQGAALTLTIADDLAHDTGTPDDTATTWPLMVTPLDNIALTVPTAAFATAFARQWEGLLPYATTDGATITSLAVSSEDDALHISGEFTTAASTDAATHHHFRAQAHPTRDVGAWRVAITPPTDGDGATADDSTHLARDSALPAALTTQIAQTLDAILMPILGKMSGALTWEWHVARAVTTNAITFTPNRVSVSTAGVTLHGMLPLEPDETDLPDDGPSFDIEAVMGPADPLATPTPLPVITVRAVRQQGVTPPCDYAWQSSLDTSLAAEHGAVLELRPPVAHDDANTMPQRTQQFPRGVIAVTATVIDAFGRTGQATIEVDVTARPSGGITTNEIAIARTLSAAAPDRAYPNPIQASGAGPVVTRQTRANTAVNTRVTSYRAALAHPKNRTPWNILAAILAVLAVVFAMGAYALLHASPLAAVSPHGVTPMSTTTVALTPQITVAPTATPTAGALTPAPTSPPEVFGRFDTPTTALQFFCAGASTTPKTVTFDNNGTAPLNWSANVIDTIGTNVPWATVNPTSGTLTTQAGNSATITVTPAAGFCAATTPASFRIQLTAPNSVPLTIVATHTAATATPSSPTPSPTPTTGP